MDAIHMQKLYRTATTPSASLSGFQAALPVPAVPLLPLLLLLLPAALPVLAYVNALRMV
jgi:hypothetical protein